ncbi:MAG: hypothetical protein JWM13_1709 [Arthrobacter sp.]|nr:hypothetical protein [Arthrobacter sp.]MCU1554223.1 hypothetical protein [Arthrobacter sp.]
MVVAGTCGGRRGNPRKTARQMWGQKRGAKGRQTLEGPGSVKRQEDGAATSPCGPGKVTQDSANFRFKW